MLRAKDAVDAVGLGSPARSALRAARRGKERVRPVPYWRQRNMRDDEHLRLLLAFVLRVDSNCVDVGANRGSLLAHMVHYAPDGKHYAFEPLPELREGLKVSFPRVAVRAEALSDRTGTATFVKHQVPTRSGLAEFGHTGGSFDVELATIDSILPSDYVPDVIKIDVEGGELEVLRGSRRTLSMHQPIVCFEHGHNAAEGRPANTVRSQAIFDELQQHGLRIFDMDGRGPFSRDDFMRVYLANTHWNFYARQ